MLQPDRNLTLTRVGPSTEMGHLMRKYWLPVLFSHELPERDARPVRVRLLGESLISFRDSRGTLGLLAEQCPHRKVSLYFGINEECGLRCGYHGWKFDVEGNCVDMPNEPADSALRRQVRAVSYACVERNGIIWAYMGSGKPPALPAFEWATVPAERRYMSKRLLRCNWAQALEGDIDTSHASFLHSQLDPDAYAKFDSPAELHYFHNDRHPRYEVVDSDFGLIMAARRDAGNDAFYWRAAQYVMPIFVMIAPFGDELLHANVWLPLDDETTMVWSIDWHPDRPLNTSERQMRTTGAYFHAANFLPDTGEAGSTWETPEQLANDYFLDDSLQKNSMFSGIASLWCQDKAVQESMGPIVDRQDEHLGQSDVAIIRWRGRILAAAEASLRGVAPPGIDPATHLIRPVGTVLPKSGDWRSALQRQMTIQSPTATA